ncbi:MAG: YdbL family probable chaperone protein [Burkholderiales bacterium]
MKRLMHLVTLAWLAFSLFGTGAPAFAQADLEINTPAISALQSSMQARHAQLAGYYDSGAVGLTRDGLLAVRDASAIPLAQRQAVNALVAAENRDRQALYREIARANGHPEWEDEVRSTFGQRWIQKAAPGWWVQSNGAWTRK